MKKAAMFLTAIVALEHVYFMVLEMFLWTAPLGMKTFGLTREFAEQSAGLAANQGLYNGFLVAGLVWSLFSRNGRALQVFFLSCVAVAGIFGALTVKMTILYVQAFPALIALMLLFLSGVREPVVTDDEGAH